MRASASPFFPEKFTDKMLNSKSYSEDKNNTELFANENFNVAFEELQNTENTVALLKLIIEKLNENQKIVLAEFLGISSVLDAKKIKSYEIKNE